ncbi:MAG: citrate/2-methylcitrate synthase [Cellvibrio sp.]|uniref:citrate/2-methylcitrate synthase n=1 Tax=Cellvibrio sp. TaxID=1965322 RepID=UPI0031A22BB3
MSQEYKHEEVRSRNEPFVTRTATNLWYEEPAADNPYLAEASYCHGYDLAELAEKRSFVDVFYLLFRGELPTRAQAQLLQQLMIALINPGPRHPATRAAMNAGVGKTDPLHILPIATAVLGGAYAGGGEVENAMQFFATHSGADAQQVTTNLLLSNESDWSVTGFDKRFGGVDPIAKKLADHLATLDAAGAALAWGREFSAALAAQGIGWTMAGVAAAAFTDLGFNSRTGACLFQLLGAPGLLAHGLEMAGKPILAMPFVSDENYVIER